MGSYRTAVAWVAHEEAVADAQPGMDVLEAHQQLKGYMTVTLIADVWQKSTSQVALDVMKERGFRIPRGFTGT